MLGLGRRHREARDIDEEWGTQHPLQDVLHRESGRELVPDGHWHGQMVFNQQPLHELVGR